MALATRLTKSGAICLGKAIAGSALVFTRGAFGNAKKDSNVIVLTEQQQDELTAMINEKISLPITDFKVRENGDLVVTLLVKNEGVKNGFRIREIGLFCQEPTTGAETLYSYDYAGDEESDYFHAENTAVVLEYSYELTTTIANAANVTAIILPPEIKIYPGVGLSMTEDTIDCNFTKATIPATNAHLTGVVNFDDGFKTKNSVAVDFGEDATINFKEDLIKLSYATLDVLNTHVNGSGITFDNGFKTADSVTVDFGKQNSIAAEHDYFNLESATLKCSNTDISLTSTSFYTSSGTRWHGNYHFPDDAVIHFDNHASITGSPDVSLNNTDIILGTSSNLTLSQFTDIFLAAKVTADDAKFKGDYNFSGTNSEGTTLKTNAYTSITGSPIFTDATASNTYKGLIKVGRNLSMSGESLNADFSLPTAAANVKGAVKVGKNLYMEGESLNAAASDNEGLNSRIKQLEINLANALIRLENTYGIGDRANLYRVEDFLGLDVIDTYSVNAYSTESQKYLRVSNPDNLRVGGFYTITDGGLHKDDLKITVFNKDNKYNAHYLLTLKDKLSCDYKGANIKLLRSTATVKDGRAYGAGKIRSLSQGASTIWSGESDNTTKTLTLDTSNSNVDRYSLEGDWALTEDGYFTLE